MRLALLAGAALSLSLLATPAPGQRTTPPRSAVSPRLQRQVVRADDGHALVVWTKRPARPRGAVLLLHGRTWSSLPNFDLQVPGQDVSLMDALVARGYAAYALDQRGYGATARDVSQWLTPDRAARDASEVLAWIASREQGTGRPALLGYSQGARTAMLAALGDSSRLSAIVLYGFPQPTSADVRARIGAQVDPVQPERRTTTLAAAGEDFISPARTPAGVKEAYARAAVAADPVRADWRAEREFAALDPAMLRVPVLLINGERDPYASRADLPGFMAKVGGVDRAWVVLAGADHAAHLERQREFVDAVVGFLTSVRPATGAR